MIVGRVVGCAPGFGSGVFIYIYVGAASMAFGVRTRLFGRVAVW